MLLGDLGADVIRVETPIRLEKLSLNLTFSSTG